MQKRWAILVSVLAFFASGNITALGSHTKPTKFRAIKRAEVISKLKRGLRGTPLSGTERILETVGWKYHLNPAFIAGASGTESSLGAVPCCGQRFNIWGWYGMPQVSSWGEAYSAYARFIWSRWPHARTPWDLNGYCGCGTTAWGNRTSYFMSRMGFSPRLDYPKGVAGI